MASRQASVEKRRASATERLAKHRAAIYSDPVSHEEYKRKERERYRKRKETGKLKTTQDLSSRQHEKKKKQWRENSAKYYKKKKQEQLLLDLTPESCVSETENLENEEIQRWEVDGNLTLFKVSEENIKASSELIPPNLNSVPGTLKIHQLTSTKPGVINTQEVSCFCGENCTCFPSMCHVLSEGGSEEPDSTKATIEVGQWALVEYDGDLFPGTVTQIAEEQYEVDTMTRIGENRSNVLSIRYPGEKVWYYRQDIRDIQL